MRITRCTSPFVVLFAFGLAAASDPVPSPVFDPARAAAAKDAASRSLGDPRPQSTGEDIATAIPIPALPYADTGSTCGYVDDYDEVCPFAGSTAPDVVYSYTPDAAIDVDLTLCDSAYDTKLYIYENSSANLVACNDDFCGADGFRSELVQVSLTPPHTYYVVIDGYGNNCGDYEFGISEWMPCGVDCPPGSLAEGEGPCFDNMDDLFNGGCGSPEPVFSDLPCSPTGITVCGDYGGFLYYGLNFRDTDWYQIHVPNGGQTITWCVTGSVPTLTGIIDGREGCTVPEFWDYATTSTCGETGCVTSFLPPGTWWLWVGTLHLGADVPGGCDNNYVATLDGHLCGPISVHSGSWATIKSRYR